VGVGMGISYKSLIATDPQVEGLGNLYPHEPYKAIAADEICRRSTRGLILSTLPVWVEAQLAVLQTCPAENLQS